jgi:Domain of unknown function (DUF397)
MEAFEVALVPAHDWRKASFCQNAECVELAAHDGKIIMRKSSQPDSGHIYFTPEEFDAFLEDAKSGRFDFTS